MSSQTLRMGRSVQATGEQRITRRLDPPVSEQPAAGSDDPIDALRMEFAQQLDQLDQEIDAVQIAVAERRRPWYQDVAVMIAVLTFLFSMATTLFAYAQASEQRVQNDRVALRQLVQRLSELGRQNAELVLQTNNSASGLLSSFIQAENALLAKQAAELIKRIPQHTSASEYVLVANAMASSNLFDRSLELYIEAERSIQDANDAVAVYRGQAAILYSLGRYDEGAAAYQRSLAVFKQFPSYGQAYEERFHIQTELTWFYSELYQTRCGEAVAHIQEAERRVVLLPNPGVPDPLVAQVQQARVYADSCGQSSAATQTP